MKYWFLILLLIYFSLIQNPIQAKLGNDVDKNKDQFGKEVSCVQFLPDKRNFTGKKIYKLNYYGWQVEALYKKDKSYSETARPKGSNVTKKVISQQEASAVADILFPKANRGPYRKLIKNANFISHFFEYGVISFEMQLDKKRRDHLGVAGVRTILYSNGKIFKDIKVNAYH